MADSMILLVGGRRGEAGRGGQLPARQGGRSCRHEGPYLCTCLKFSNLIVNTIIYYIINIPNIPYQPSAKSFVYSILLRFLSDYQKSQNGVSPHFLAVTRQATICQIATTFMARAQLSSLQRCILGFSSCITVNVYFVYQTVKFNFICLVNSLNLLNWDCCDN